MTTIDPDTQSGHGAALPCVDAVRLLADIGGTNARFALQTPAGIESVDVLACASYPSLMAAVQVYLERAAARGYPVAAVRHAALAIANPVEEDVVRMTNHHWTFSTAQLRHQLGLSTLLVVNDFAALARSLPLLTDGQRERIGGGAEVPGRPIGLIGPGTGLGVSGLVPTGAGCWITLAGEGGHASFAPVDHAEARVLEMLWDEFGHVSAERLLSGAGLELIHRALFSIRLDAPEITAGALDGRSPDCRRTVDTFCAILGSMAGNVALTLGATGGMYIGGGIVPRLGPLFRASAFRSRFEDKGRLGAYLARIPTFLITDRYPALRGAAALLGEHIAIQQ